MPKGIYIHESPSEENLKKRSKSLKINWENASLAKRELRLRGLRLGLGNFKKGCAPWNKGKHFSEESKKKMSESHKGAVLSIETRKKMSKFHKGKTTWLKGLTKKTDKRLAKKAEASKGKPSNMLGKHHSEEAKKEMSKAKLKNPTRYWLNKKRNEEVKRKISQSLKGENSPHWRGGISFEPYSVEFNRELKELIRNRDNYKCQLCGMPECENIRKLSIHHIDYNKQNSLPNNLTSLCTGCNTKVNYNRQYWTNYFKERFIC